MADGTIEYAIRVTDQASPAIHKTQTEARMLSTVLAELTAEQARQDAAAVAAVAASMRQQQALVAQAAQIRDVTAAMRQQTQVAAQQQAAQSGGPALASITSANAALVAQGSAANVAAGGLRNTAFQAQNLRFQLMDVGTMLAGGASPFLILATQGPQIAQVFMGGASAAAVLGGAVGALAAPVALLLAPVAALAVVWYNLNQQLKEAEGLMKSAAAGATAQQKAGEALNEVEARTLEANQLATGAITAKDVAYRKEVEAIDGVINAQRKLLDVELAGASAGSDEYRRILSQIVAIEQKRGALTGLAAATRDAETGTKSHTSAIRAQRDAVRDLLKEYKEAMAFLSNDPTAGLAEGFVADMVAAGVKVTEERAKGEEAARKDNLAADRDRLAQWLQGRVDAERKSAEAYRAEMERQGIIAGAIGTASSAGLSLASGDVGGALATAAPAIGMAMGGPIGAAVGDAVAQGFNFLTELGKNGAESIGDKIDETTRNLRAGLKELPTLLVEVLPQALSKLAAELVIAQYRMIWELVRLPFTIAEHFGEVLADWWPGWDGLKDILRDVWREAIAYLAQILDDFKSLDFSQGSALRGTAEVGARVGLGIATMGLSELAIAGVKGASGGDIGWMATARSNGPAASGMLHQPRNPTSQGGPSVTINTASLHPDFVPGMQAHTDRAYGQYGLRKAPSWGVTNG